MKKIDAINVLQNIEKYQTDQNTLALLTVLDMGRKEIVEGKFKPAREVFAKMDQKILSL